MVAVEEIPLVGRAQELGILHQALERAVTYETPQAIVLVGSQGVGKTRLVEHWLGEVVDKHSDVRVFKASASQEGQSYAPFSQLLRARFGVKEGDGDALATLRAQVEKVLQDRRVAEMLHFLGAFIGVTVPDNPFLRALEESAEQHDAVALTVLARFLEEDAAVTPMVLLVEDLHLADSASLTLFQRLAESLEGAPVMLIGTCRPALFVRESRFTSLDAELLRVDLPLLTPQESLDQLKHLLAPVEELPPTLVDTAVELSGGNPLFLVQLVRLLMDKGIVSVADGALTLDDQGLEEIDLPLSVEEAVQVRVDLLTPAERDVLEKAACVGSVFWVEALISLSRLQQEVEPPMDAFMADVLHDTITEILSRLEARDYVLRLPDSSIPGTTEYAFKNNLERKLIGSGVHPTRQEQFHLFAAQWLETRLVERSEAQLEELGAHYELGGNPRRASFCFIFAGDRARARYANDRAARFYQRGIDLMELHDAFSKLDALHNLGDVLTVLGRNEEAVAHFRQMLHYAWLLDHQEKGGTAHRRLGTTFCTLGDYEKAATHLHNGMRLFKAAEDARGLAATMDDVGRLHWLKGEYEDALEFHRQAMDLKRGLGARRDIAVSLTNIGKVHLESGSFAQAQDCYLEALEIRKEEGDKLGMMDSLAHLGGVHRAQSDYGKAHELLSQALELAKEIGARLDEAALRISLADAKLQLGKPKEAEEQLKQAEELSGDLGDRRLRADCCRTRAEVRLALGDQEGAEQPAAEAVEIVEDLELLPEMGLALRVQGEVFAAGEISDENKARTLGLFRRAIELFTELGNDMELARTFAALADYHDRCGEWEDAHHFRSSADEIFSRLT